MKLSTEPVIGVYLGHSEAFFAYFWPKWRPLRRILALLWAYLRGGRTYWSPFEAFLKNYRPIFCPFGALVGLSEAISVYFEPILGLGGPIGALFRQFWAYWCPFEAFFAFFWPNRGLFGPFLVHLGLWRGWLFIGLGGHNSINQEPWDPSSLVHSQTLTYI